MAALLDRLPARSAFDVALELIGRSGVRVLAGRRVSFGGDCCLELRVELMRRRRTRGRWGRRGRQEHLLRDETAGAHLRDGDEPRLPIYETKVRVVIC